MKTKKSRRKPAPPKKRARRSKAGRFDAAIERAAPVPIRGKEREFTTVGVRLVHTPNPTRVFTYKVLLPHPYEPGDVVPVEAAGAMLIGIVVRVDREPRLDGPFTYRWLRHRIRALHGADVRAEPTRDASAWAAGSEDGK